MRIFLTGGTGFIGPAVVQELRRAGHEVLGLARSDASAAALTALGADVHRGSVSDLDALRAGARESDGVVHLALTLGEKDLAETLADDRRALTTFGETLAGSDRPLVFASATSFIAPGRMIDEHDVGDPGSPVPRAKDEAEILRWADQGVRVAAVRLATLVHGPEDRRGFVPVLVETARARARAVYVGDGLTRWPAVHRLDAAALFRLALESAPAGTRLHAVAEEGVAFRDIAGAVAAELGVPCHSIPADRAPEHFTLLPGPLAAMPGTDIAASSRITRETFGWQPTQPGVLDDIAAGVYSGPRVSA